MVLSTFHEFRDEFDAHMQGACPAGKCKQLTEFQVSDECIGCTKCAQACAVDAIECTPLEHARINQERCIKCGVCGAVCPQHAIKNVHEKFSKEQGENTISKNTLMSDGVPKRMIEGQAIEVDGEKYPFTEGSTLLDYASEHGWIIPTLCYLKDKSESAHCMVCAAWDVSLGRYVPSCEQLVQKGHVYQINSQQVQAFRSEALSLMLNRHDLKCGKCSGKGDCGFFDLLREYRVKKQNSVLTYPEKIVAKYVTFDAGKCILCHRCIPVSQKQLTMHHRGGKSCVSPAPESWDSISELMAAELSRVCPTGALCQRKYI